MSTSQGKSDALTITMSELDLLMEFAFESHLPFVMWGVKAVGKTTRINDIAKKHGYRLVSLHLATQDVVDLIGMMAKVPDDADAHRVAELFEKSTMGYELTADEFAWVRNTIYSNKLKTIWTRPEWLTSDENVKTIYFLDEFNRGNKFVMAAMLPFLNEGKLHQHKIGPHDLVIAACNPSTGKYSVNDAFEHDEALKDRCGHIILEPTREEFFNYAVDKLDSVTLTVLRKNPKYTEVEKFDLPFKVEPSRRSLINVMSIVGKKDPVWIRKYGRIVIGTYLGSDFLSNWWESKFQKDQYLEIDQLIRFDENRQTIIDTIKALVNGVETIKTDIFEASVDTIITWTDSQYKDGATKLEWLHKYLSLPFIPKDSCVSMLTKINTLNKPYLLEFFHDNGLLSQLPEIANSNAFESSLKGNK